jgi:hypothetical protein
MEPNNEGKQERTSRMQRKVLEHLAQSGNVSYSCKRAGINRDTYYAWKQEDKLFAHDAVLAINYGKDFVNDLAHTQLIANIQKGDMKAVRFQLISCHDDYRPRRARAPVESEDQNFEPIRAIIISTAPPRPAAPSPAPSATPMRDEKKHKPASPSAPKPSLPSVPEPEIIDDGRFQLPPRRGPWSSDDNDDGVAMDDSWVWGKR